jgi:hypothetical protein
LELRSFGVTVPAGTFDTPRVEISSADGGSDKKTFWIANQTHKVVKVTAVLASMGGAMMTQELVQQTNAGRLAQSMLLSNSVKSQFHATCVTRRHLIFLI